MKELWLESVPFSNQSFTSDPKSNRPMSLIGWWWSAYLLGNFVGYFLVKMIGSETIESLITFTWTSGVGDIIDIIAAIITIKMVYIIVRFQEEKFKTIQIV